jgi:hypothetical protein
MTCAVSLGKPIPFLPNYCQRRPRPIAGCSEAEVPQHLARHRMCQDGTMRKMGDTLRDCCAHTQSPRSPELSRPGYIVTPSTLRTI